ncbi:MAG: phosphoadenylyl-sulfate reductase [Vulcanimicrobiaceae bacterium]
MTAATPLERAAAVLDGALATYRGKIALACSFGGPSGMVLLDLVVARDPAVPVYFLDTGLLFEETYALVERVKDRYGIEPIAVRSELSVDQQAARFGEALWARDPNACCAIRKVEPQRAFLAPYDAWITGIRRDQSATRANASTVSNDDAAGGIAKIAPLADWTSSDVWSYVFAHDVPYNPLNDHGYPSLGCTHCTRAIAPGEDPRAGRWSGFDKLECGLHASATAGGGNGIS